MTAERHTLRVPERWIDAYTTALEQTAIAPVPGLRLGDDGIEQVLNLARIVAHGTERRNAPLATHLAGHYVALLSAGGVDPGTALADAVRVARKLIEDGHDPGML